MGGFLSALLNPIDPMLARRRAARPTPAPGLSQLANGPKSPLSTGGKLLRGIESAGVGVLAGPNAIPAAENFYRGGGGPGLGVMDDGGPVPESGPYNLEEGEFVVPRRAAGAILPVLGGGAAQRDRVPGSPALSELARNPGDLFIAPPARGIDSPSGPAPANIAPIGAARSRSALSDSYANRVGRLRSFMQDTARKQAEPPNADLDADKASPTAAAPAAISPIAVGQGPAASRYAQDLGQAGPTAAERAAAGVPQTTRQKLLRGIKAAGVGVLTGGHEAFPAALNFYEAPEKKAEQAWQTQQEQDKTAAGMERQQQLDTRQASIDDLNRRNVESEIGEHKAAADRDKREQPDDPADKKLDAYVNDQGQQTLIFQRPDGSTYERAFSKVQGKTDKITDPFEAFAYGSPEEKKAAQDFLTFEKKIGTQFDKPGEIEQRYSLYQKDPDAYKAMFGDRGSAQDQQQASRMLRYFDGERKRIEQDWTLDETTRAQRLGEIDQLEQPYLDAA